MNMRYYVFLLLTVCALLGLSAAGPAADWAVPAYPSPYSWTSAVAYNAATHKLYVGHESETRNRKCLVVFDTDANGKIIGTGRRYLSHPAPAAANELTWITCLLVDTRHNKLFYGIGANPGLGMYNLDASGEPTGTPQAYSVGMTYQSIQCIAQHPSPTINRLYCVGWGNPGVYAINQDANGVPTGAPIVYNTGGYGKYSVHFRSDGTKCYIGDLTYDGGYIGMLTVADVDGNGNLNTGNLRYYTATGTNWYLTAGANDRGVYYKTTAGTLAYWSLDANGEPSPAAPTVTTTAIQDFYAKPTDRLILAMNETFTDAIDLQTKVSGMRVKDYLLNTNGSLGALQRQSAVLERQQEYFPGYSTSTNLNGSPDAAVITTWLSNPRGNRLANLSMRATLLHVDATGELYPYYTGSQLNTGSYLKYTYSSRWGKVYAADGSNINVHTLSTSSTSNVTCANSTNVVAVDDQAGTYGTLYVALNNGSVDVRDLDANGDPSGTANAISTGMSGITVMTVNPTTSYVYVCGWGGTAGQIGATNMYRVPSGYYTANAAVNVPKDRLYVTYAYNGNNNLFIYTLQDGAVPTGATATTYADGIPMRKDNPWRGMLGDIRVNSAKNRLYFIATSEQTYSGQSWLVVYPLNGSGDPITDTSGHLHSYPIKSYYNSSSALCLSNDGKSAFIGGWGDARITVQPLDDNGDVTGSQTVWVVGQYGLCGSLQMTSDSRTMLAGTYPGILEKIALQSDGIAESAPSGSFTMNGQNISYGQMRAGITSGWTNLNQALQNGYGTVRGVLSISGATIVTARVRFDFSLDGGATVAGSRTAEFAGNSSSLYIPRYDVDTVQVPQYVELVNTGGEYLEKLRNNLLPSALLKEERPQNIITANVLFNWDADPVLADMGLGMLGMMGHNTLMLSGSGMSAEDNRTMTKGAGATRFKYGIYNPPSYFDYNTEYFAPGYQDNWAVSFKPSFAAIGAKPEEVALFHMADEPGWYFPSVITDVNGGADHLQVFRDYLSDLGFTPAFFGKGAWTDVNPIGQSQATTLENRRLFYWTARFYADSLANAFAASSAALRGQLNSTMFTTTNLNNWPGRYYIPSPNAQIANNPIVGPDSAMGMPDWFELGRKNGVSCIWTEDWFSDTSAGVWPVYADLLRCASREGTGMEYGAYVVGQSGGAVPDGMKYKVMSLVGHGTRALDAYCYGPIQIFGDGWSTKSSVYKPYADAFRVVGKSEKVLYPGRPRNGMVAILVSKASQPWDGTSGQKFYMNEIYGLYYALNHSQYPTDFIDDTDIEQGKLTTYGYSVLYVSAPNLSEAAQTAIVNWVNAGGVVAMLPGSAATDEYNTATTTLQSIMGASWGAVSRVDCQPYASWRTARTTITVLNQTILGTPSDETEGQLAGLTLNGATSLATLPGDTSAVTLRQYGAGYVFAFGYWPGFTYATLNDYFDPTNIPTDWQDSTRLIITAPCRYVNTAKFVACSQPLVECALLESENGGIGVTLLNWNTQPKAVTVSINKLTMPTAILNEVNAAITGGTLKVSSVEKGDLDYTVNGNNIDVSLTVNTVDVLMLTW